MAQPETAYVLGEILKLWKQQADSVKATTEVIQCIRENVVQINKINERVVELEQRAGVTTTDLAETRHDLKVLGQGVDAVTAGLQHTNDMIDLEDIERRLADEGIAPPEDAP